MCGRTCLTLNAADLSHCVEEPLNQNKNSKPESTTDFKNSESTTDSTSNKVKYRNLFNLGRTYGEFLIL